MKSHHHHHHYHHSLHLGETDLKYIEAEVELWKLILFATMPTLKQTAVIVIVIIIVTTNIVIIFFISEVLINMIVSYLFR